MTDLKAIKRRILREDKLPDIYEAMGCESIAIRGKRIEAGLPDRFHSSNRRAVQTKFNEHLTSSIRNRSDFSGDIFSLVSYLVHDKRGVELQQDLHNAKTFICETLGWREYLQGGEFEKRVDHLAPMKAILRGRKRKREIKPNPVLPEVILNQYLPLPSQSWLEEGISLRTQKMFDVRFDLESKRIILPMRNRFGKLVGVKGRILKDEDDERKYLYLYPFNNSQELFGFHFAHPYILLEKKLYLFEGEKSVLHMFDEGIYNCIAIGGGNPSEEQSLMIMRCGLDIDIVICFDTDKSEEEVSDISKMFPNRNVYAIFDRNNLLGEKESPIDRGIEVFNMLEENFCIKLSEK